MLFNHFTEIHVVSKCVLEKHIVMQISHGYKDGGGGGRIVSAVIGNFVTYKAGSA